MKNLLVICGFMFLIGCSHVPREPIEAVFYPAPPETPRIQYLTTISTESDIATPNRFRRYLLGKDNVIKRLQRPFSVAHEKNKLYVVDKTLKKVVIIDLQNKKMDYIKDRKAGALQEPMGMTIDTNGFKYVADAGREQVVVYDKSNNFVRVYGEAGQFRPTGVAVNENYVYVCDIRDNEIEVLDKKSGQLLYKFGKTGSEVGELFKPTHIELDGGGNLYVTDAFNFRVQKFSPDGKSAKALGYHGTHPGAFARPKGIAIDRQGYLYAADAAFELIQVLDTNSGDPLLPFGKFGPDPGSTYLPGAVHIDYDNLNYFKKYVDRDFKLEYLIYVSNMLGDDKLNVYGFGKWQGPVLKATAAPPPVQDLPGKDKQAHFKEIVNTNKTLIDNTQAIEIATDIKIKLADSGKIDSGWSSISASEVTKKKFTSGSGWVVVFNNPKLKIKRQRSLYIFLTLEGNYRGSTYKGK